MAPVVGFIALVGLGVVFFALNLLWVFFGILFFLIGIAPPVLKALSLGKRVGSSGSIEYDPQAMLFWTPGFFCFSFQCCSGLSVKNMLITFVGMACILGGVVKMVKSAKCN
jgi:hypothetical protein